MAYPTAHENWYPVRTSALAEVPLDKMAQLDSVHLAKIVIDVSEYNSNYIDGATKRINELKYSLAVVLLMFLVSTLFLVLNVLRKKT